MRILRILPGAVLLLALTASACTNGSSTLAGRRLADGRGVELR
jgi:hypothetical protein